MFALNDTYNIEFFWLEQFQVDCCHKISDQRNIFSANGFEVSFWIWEWKYGMVHHQEILSVVTITRYGSRTDDIQQLDCHAPCGSGAVPLEGSLRVREPEDGIEGVTRLAKYSMLQIGANFVRDSKLRNDTTCCFGMLASSKVTANGFHSADGKIDHLLEELWIIKFWVFAIQF